MTSEIEADPPRKTEPILNLSQLSSAKVEDSVSDPDPYLTEQPTTVQEGEFVLLVFADKRQIFAQCLSHWRGKTPPLKINKRTYSTANLVGLPYGTVLELNVNANGSGKDGLVPLPDGEDVLPRHDDLALIDQLPQYDRDEKNDHNGNTGNGKAKADANVDANTDANADGTDNRHLVDDNTSQAITHDDLHKMRKDLTGAEIVKTIIQNSSTFATKTNFSQAKYIKKKQMKYQPRCRLVRCTSSSICQAMFAKDARKIMNLREDTLAQILSYANVSAGCKTLIFDGCLGIVTGALAQRMGGYGSIHSIYVGNSPGFFEMIARFNLSFVEYTSIKWLHAGRIFHDEHHPKEEAEGKDLELAERKKLIWPCPLQPHTENYLINMAKEQDRVNFLDKRCGRFARKLTRPTPDEVWAQLNEGEKCDSIIVACQYDPKTTLLELLPFLEPSCPFVVFYEYMEPLLELFHELQSKKMAINIRLSDTWMREYQVLPNRTHPNMNMSQSGGFILTGIKLCPIHGKNELDEDLMREIRAEVGGRRGKKRKSGGGNNNGGKKKR